MDLGLFSGLILWTGVATVIQNSPTVCVAMMTYC